MKREGGGRETSPIEKEIARTDSNEYDQKLSSKSEKVLSTLLEEKLHIDHTVASLPEAPLRSQEAGIPPETESTLNQEESQRQVIAVSASKGPSAFFNLARKFLTTDKLVDLSALEGAIVSAVDAAQRLERSKLATIVRIQTSYVVVEPRRRKASFTHQTGIPSACEPASKHGIISLSDQLKVSSTPSTTARSKKGKGSELRRARIIITVERTPEYDQWLLENPTQEISTVDDEGETEHVSNIVASLPPKR